MGDVTEDVEGHRFNDDVLTGPTDVVEAGKRFQDLIHVLDHPELRKLLQQYDVPANAAKKTSQKWGVTAVLLASLALFGAASTPLLHHLSEDCAKSLEFLSALLGVVSIAIGLKGVLWRRAKTGWLQNRLMTERLRQFHFQAFVCHLGDIVDSLADQKAADDYVAKRVGWFAEFRARIENGRVAEFTDLVSDDPKSSAWLYDPCTPIPKDKPVPDRIFDAYRELRIRHQLRYANYKLSAGTSLLPATIRAQLAFFSNVTLFGIAILLAIYLGIAVAIAIGGKAYQPPPWIHVGVIWIAIAALAARALEEGLQPARELERYLRYKAAVQAILDRFEAAKVPWERLEIMREMERLSFDEMVDFLKTHNDARYVM